VIFGIALVFGLASWRYFHGATEQSRVAKPAAPVVARPLVPSVAMDASASLNQVELNQQTLLDDFQLMQGRVAKQEAEIKRLRAELESLGQRYDSLISFASTQKESKPAPAVEPTKKKKRVVRRSNKRKAT
jgi:hypothetical protein